MCNCEDWNGAVTAFLNMEDGHDVYISYQMNKFYLCRVDTASPFLSPVRCDDTLMEITHCPLCGKRLEVNEADLLF